MNLGSGRIDSFRLQTWIFINEKVRENNQEWLDSLLLKPWNIANFYSSFNEYRGGRLSFIICSGFSYTYSYFKYFCVKRDNLYSQKCSLPYFFLSRYLSSYISWLIKTLLYILIWSFIIWKNVWLLVLIFKTHFQIRCSENFLIWKCHPRVCPTLSIKNTWKKTDTRSWPEH